MRICLVSREVAPFFGAGIGTYVAEMANGWAAAGHETHIVTAPHENLRSWLQARGEHAAGNDPFPGVRIHLTEDPEGPLPPYAFQRHAWASYRLLQRLHSEHAFDYIEFPEYWAEGSFALAAKRTTGAFEGAVLGVRLHSPTRLCRALNQESWLNEELAILQCAEERCITDADVVLSPTEALLGLTSAHQAAASVGRRLQVCEVVPYPFDAAGFARGSPPQASAVGPQTVLYFGRLERRKGVRLLIQAAVTLLEAGRDTRFRLIGADTRTGPGCTSLREHLIASVPPEFRDRFSFEDPRPRDQLAAAVGECIASGGVCCFPSLWENFPNACLEAMALGAPVVASDAGGMAEIIEDDASGQLFRAGDPTDLASKLSGLLNDGARRQAMGIAARQRIANLCAPSAIVLATIDVVQRAQSPADHGSCALRRSLHSCAIDEISRVPPTDSSAWVLVADHDTPLPDPASTVAAAFELAIARNPDVEFIACIGAGGSKLAIPVGLTPELLSCLPAGAPGLVGIRASLLARLPDLSGFQPQERFWALACAAAAAGAAWAIVPEPLVSTARESPIEQASPAAIARIAEAFPGLAAGSAIPIRLAAAARARLEEEIRRLRAELGKADASIADLETQLASLRYRLADRVNTAIKATGVHGLAKAVARTVHREEPRP